MQLSLQTHGDCLKLGRDVSGSSIVSLRRQELQLVQARPSNAPKTPSKIRVSRVYRFVI